MFSEYATFYCKKNIIFIINLLTNSLTIYKNEIKFDIYIVS